MATTVVSSRGREAETAKGFSRRCVYSAPCCHAFFSQPVQFRGSRYHQSVPGMTEWEYQNMINMDTWSLLGAVQVYVFPGDNS